MDGKDSPHTESKQEYLLLLQTKYCITQKPWKEGKKSKSQQEDKIMVNIYDASNNTASNFTKQLTLCLKGEIWPSMIIMRYFKNPSLMSKSPTWKIFLKGIKQK